MKHSVSDPIGASHLPEMILCEGLRQASSNAFVALHQRAGYVSKAAI